MSEPAFSAAFCDSAAALGAARSDGLDTQVEILTISPLLPHAAKARFKFLPDRLAVHNMDRILSLRRKLQTDACERACAEDEIAEFAHLAAFTTLLVRFFVWMMDIHHQRSAARSKEGVS